MRKQSIFVIPAGLFVVGAVIASTFILDDVLLGVDQNDGRMETTQALAPSFATQSRSVAMNDSFAAAPASKQVSSRISPPQASETSAQDRKLRETHRFTFEAQRDAIKEHYRRTTSACVLEWCTMLNGSISTQGSTHHANIAVRVDPDRMDQFIQAVQSGEGHLDLLNHSRTAQDMTAEFQDLAARQESQKALRDRLIALTKSSLADDVSDLLEIEQELARVQGRIESMEARLRTINTVTERTTIHISFRSEALEAPVSHPPYIQNALKEVGSIASQNTGHVIKLTAALAPYIIPLTLVVFLTRWLFRRRKARVYANTEAA